MTKRPLIVLALLAAVGSLSVAGSVGVQGGPSEVLMGMKSQARTGGRDKLLDTGSWVREFVVLVRPGEEVQFQEAPRRAAWKAEYKAEGRAIGLVAVFDGTRQRWAVLAGVPGAHAFYIVEGDDVVGCRVGWGNVVFDRSLFSATAPSDDLTNVIGRFNGEVDDARLNPAEVLTKAVVADLRVHPVDPFWVAGGGLSSALQFSVIVAVAYDDGRLTLHLRNGDGDLERVYEIDIRTGQSSVLKAGRR